MLTDFYMMEFYYGAEQASRSVEDLIREYGVENIQDHLNRGLLRTNAHSCQHTENSDILCWLSEKGRIYIKNTPFEYSGTKTV